MHKRRVAGAAPKTSAGRVYAKNLATKRFHCAACDHSYAEKYKLDRHYKTDKHKLKVATLKKAAESSS